MSTSSTKSNLKLVEALKSTNWRQPVKPSYHESDDLMVNKKRQCQGSSSVFDYDDPATHRRVPVYGASPLRSASSIGFTSDPFFDTFDDEIEHRQDMLRSKVGILSGIAVAANAIAVPAKRAASAFLNLSRSSQKRQGNSTYVFDVVVQHEDCYDQKVCRTHNGDFPMAEIESIKDSNRFRSPGKAAKERALEEQLRMTRLDEHNHQDDASRSTTAILTDSAVINVEGFPTQSTRTSDGGSKIDQYQDLMAKLNKAFKEKKMQDMLGIRSPNSADATTRKVSHRRQDRSDDSGVAFSNGHTSKQSSTSLNPAAKEFVIRNAPGDPAIIAKGKRFDHEFTPESKAAAKENALNDALNCLAEYTKEFKNLQEVVQNTILQCGPPGVGTQEPLSTMMALPQAPPFVPAASLNGYPTPPYASVAGPSPAPFLGPQAMMVPSSGFMAPPFGFPGLISPTMSSFGPLSPPHLMGPGSVLPPAPLGPMMPHPPPPGYRGPLPMPPPGYGPGPGFGPGPFGPGFNFDSLLPPHHHQQMPQGLTVPAQFVRSVSKPKAPNTQSQMEYEAHIEWRKANEPGYALKCKERQHRRAARSSVSKTGSAIPIVAPPAAVKA
ncbi:hypothetical protein ACHAQA_001807 [Verticillium albo-atrum]